MFISLYDNETRLARLVRPLPTYQVPRTNIPNTFLPYFCAKFQPMPTIDTFDFSGKRVLIRVDFNVPLNDSFEVTDDTRIRAALPTIKRALDAGAAVIVLSHLGRPTEGEWEDQFSLGPVARHLGILLGQSVTLAENWLDGVAVEPGQVVMCENVRFNVGDKNFHRV